MTSIYDSELSSLLTFFDVQHLAFFASSALFDFPPPLPRAIPAFVTMSAPATSYADLIEFGFPTLDRPFGLKLWPIFNKAFDVVVGYPADDFAFVSGKTPMSTLKETSIFIVIYYIIIFGGREVMRNRESFKLKALFLVHNFLLTTVSGILLVLYAEQLIPTVVRHGVFYAICATEGGWTQPLVVLYYVRISASTARAA